MLGSRVVSGELVSRFEGAVTDSTVERLQFSIFLVEALGSFLSDLWLALIVISPGSSNSSSVHYGVRTGALLMNPVLDILQSLVDEFECSCFEFFRRELDIARGRFRQRIMRAESIVIEAIVAPSAHVKQTITIVCFGAQSPEDEHESCLKNNKQVA
jgi:hypothetical protein